MNLLKRKLKQKGMTLIEVMVVITSSLVLAGVVFTGGKVLNDRSKVHESQELIRAFRQAVFNQLASFNYYPLKSNMTAISWVPGWDTRSQTTRSGLKGSFGPVYLAGVSLLSSTTMDAYAIILTEVPVEYCGQIISGLSTETDFIGLSQLTGGKQVEAKGSPIINAPFRTWIDPQAASAACNGMGPLVSIHFVYTDVMRSYTTTPAQPNYNPPPPSGLPVWTP